MVQDQSPKRRAGRAVRVDDVAREAGVSPITVSRALSQPELVRAETRARVAAAVEKTGYVVNTLASTLRSGHSNIVAVFVASLQNPHFVDAMQGALEVFEGSRFHLMFSQMGYSEVAETPAVKALLPFRPAGMMFSGIVRAAETRRVLKDRDIPVVEMWGESDEPIDMLVGSSAFEGGRIMGAHFASKGFRRVAYCGHTESRGGDRLAGFAAGLAPAGVAPGLVLPMEGTRSVHDGITALNDVLARMPDCDAIFFGTDVLAAGALIRAQQLGIPVPGKLAVAGYGDLDFAEQMQPTLTTVRVGGHEIGRNAGKMMLARLTGQPVEHKVIDMPVLLEARQTTGGA